MNKTTLISVVTVIIAILVVVYVVAHRSPSEPSVAVVTPLLQTFLTSGKSSQCSGQTTVDHLSDVRLGTYSKQFGGWPIYASHQETCRSGRNSTTYDGLADASKNTAVAFVRTSNGTPEVFMPQVFESVQGQMQNDLNSSLNNLQCHTAPNGNYVCQ